MTQQTWSRSMKSIAGAFLLGLGFLLLFANLDAIAASLTESIGHSAPQGTDPVLTFGLAAMHAVQSYTFEHSRFVSGLWQILVSFWPLILIILGAVWLRDTFRGLLSAYRIGPGFSAMEERG